MDILELELPGLKLLKPRLYADERGFFLESYRASLYASLGIDCSFVQDNRSYSKKGTLRGMHFQRKPGQAKLVSVIEGEVFDVAVDLRQESPTFGKWMGVYLDGKSCQQLFIPVGFAHGFCVLSENAHVAYKVSAPYDPEEEKGFRFDDPEIGIEWPIEHPLVSLRDLAAPRFREVVSR
jgi:dTDP-4-dehydrorhamnose 3,5-epimerase